MKIRSIINIRKRNRQRRRVTNTFLWLPIIERKVRLGQDEEDMVGRKEGDRIFLQNLSNVRTIRFINREQLNPPDSLLSHVTSKQGKTNPALSHHSLRLQIPQSKHIFTLCLDGIHGGKGKGEERKTQLLLSFQMLPGIEEFDSLQGKGKCIPPVLFCSFLYVIPKQVKTNLSLSLTSLPVQIDLSEHSMQHYKILSTKTGSSSANHIPTISSKIFLCN